MTHDANTRIADLNSLKAIADKYLKYYQELSSKQSKDWITRKCVIAIEALEATIHKINIDLTPKKVSAFCGPTSKPISSLAPEVPPVESVNERDYLNYFNEVFTQTKPDFVLFELARLSPVLNIEHDLSWLSDGMLSDFIEIGHGSKNIDYLGTLVPYKIKETNSDLLPYLQKNRDFKNICSLITRAVKCTEEKDYLASNILLITATESLARKFAFKIHRYQNPELPEKKSHHFIFKKYTSLSKLITDGQWPHDFPISFSDAIVNYKDVNDANLNQLRGMHKKHSIAFSELQEITSAISTTLVSNMPDHAKKAKALTLFDQIPAITQNLISDEKPITKISLSIMLDFLVRKYKDDRNSIIHGDLEQFDLQWKNYVNYAALVKAVNVLRQYLEFYQIKPDGKEVPIIKTV